MKTFTTAPSFSAAVVAKANELLKRRAATGIALNGSDFACVAGDTGFAAVTATEIAYKLQDDAMAMRARWRNCNHDTVGAALRAAGWCGVYAGRKNFYLKDPAEAARLRATAEGKRTARREKLHAKHQAKVAMRTEHGASVSIFVKYPQKHPSFSCRSFMNRGREFVVAPQDALTAAQKYAVKAASIEVVVRTAGEDYLYFRWTWRRGRALQGAEVQP